MSEFQSEIKKLIELYLVDPDQPGKNDVEFEDLTKALTDKFHIIPKSDNPDKWVEVVKFYSSPPYPREYHIPMTTLKWRGE